MGAFDFIDPATVNPTAGNVLVKIVEVLGGQTKSGLHIPGGLLDHGGKDTFYGEILSVGPAPALEHYRPSERSHLGVRPNSSGKTWSPEMMAEFEPGDILVLPRDVPLVFVWEEQRFGLVHLHEAILHIKGDSFDPQEFQFVPWTPPPKLEGADVTTTTMPIGEHR